MENHAIRQKVKDILSIEKRKLISEVVRLEQKEEKLEIAVDQLKPSVKTTNIPYEVKLTNYGKLSTCAFLFMSEQVGNNKPHFGAKL